LDAENPLIASTLLNLADVRRREGDYDQAQRLAEQALRAWDKKQGPYHAEIVAGCSLLGNVAYSRRDYATARSMFSRAVELSREAFGERHPMVARGRVELADTLLRLEEYELARRQLDAALEVLSETLPPDHPDIGAGLTAYSRLNLDTGDERAALRSALEAENVGRAHLRLTLRSLPERQSLLFATSRVSGLDLALTIAADELEGPERGATLDALIRSRALVLDEMASRYRSLTGSDDAAIRGLVEQLASARTRLANLIIRRHSETDPERLAKLVANARVEKERIESRLADASLAFRQELAADQVGLAEVEQHIPDNCALVSYVRYQRHSPRDDPTPSYMAFVWSPDSRYPQSIPLGPAKEIELLVARWRNEMSRAAGGVSLANSETRCREVGADLRRAVWDPIVSRMDAVGQVFVVPDGVLHTVNLAALPSGNGRYLVEFEPAIHYLAAERDLVRASGEAPTGVGLLAMGDPDFDAISPRTERRSPDESTEFPPTRNLGRANLDSMRFAALPGTGKEVQEIVDLWRRRRNTEGRSIVGEQATESRFKVEARGKEIIHVATHGFFLDDTGARGRDVRGIGGLANRTLSRPTTDIEVNPLLRSGLVFAGANHHEVAAGDQDDGILTAEEIAGLDLSGVAWAVLSACDTGAGEVVDGEGVLGLRRAFQTAGARTVLMSLWPVEDQAGREWMRRLYEERLAGRSTPDAVRRASVGFINEQRRIDATTHPFYWGAFVAVGDWR
jgi:CHAT domain-containing protein